MKDDEPLRVLQYVLHPTHLFHQGHHKASLNLPDCCVVAPVGHERKVTPTPLLSLIVHNASMEVSTRVGVNPFPVYLLESAVFRGQGVTRNISPLPLPVL